ncbi:MAG: aminotransferase class V-fold PLP-dependent enzyme [Taibaiella sp.]|nr:aminotransferase class V-fold PLP-dependent enzyme [Taibaiella sp.]
MNKRTFLKNASLLSIGSLSAIPALGRWADAVAAYPEAAGGSDEDYWINIRRGYRLKPDYINLENGYYCIMPQETLNKYEAHIREVNLQGAYYLRTVQFENKAIAAKKLADFVGCSADELVITRNTTESLDMIIGGLDWKAGDEAVMAEQDYGAMLDMFKQVARRYGVVNKVVSVPANPQTDEEIVAVYEQAITPRTKLLMVCHMINITGQILPVRKICDMAHARGVQVMVDGAHALAHIQFKIPELHCDYYGSSLHKWLGVPIGAGLLYVKQEHIPRVWPLLAEEGKRHDDILRLNHTGTHPPATDLTIADAIDLYHTIGGERKEIRLRHLQQYWTDKVRMLPHIVLNTPAQPQRSCAIANVGIKGMKPALLAETLLKKYKIYTVAIDNAAAGVQGCRITPNVYTTTAELDELVKALTEIGG